MWVGIFQVLPVKTHIQAYPPMFHINYCGMQTVAENFDVQVKSNNISTVEQQAADGNRIF